MTTPTRGRPRSQAAHTAILRAALDLFIERGIEGMSIEQVARRSGVGKPTIYRRWPDKDALVADAIEAHVGTEIDWPTAEEIAAVAPEALVRRNLAAAARTAADPRFRGLVAQVYGSAVSHPQLMQVYWDRYVMPRRELTKAMLRRVRRDLDTDLDVIIDMLAGAVTYRILQPNPPTERQMRRYLEALYRNAGLLPG
ncbi:TetR family transcriptional regulator [Mycolicibacterium phlei]|uniref:TetR family transcriptional regulator n=1 Tax=Mycolicibacterium phlei DSM 43239 = CCUG 21000 TaxID=1226750 RepID=A0A5N5V759_MYCPH|nr:TetR/AcrR family transcriptional regulator [Mycolicibacterium phlei]VEG08678.1 TetR family transcriptional regulator [Mycobacteroides chelonae]AMO60559.1 Bacterial regulatory protein, tetR family [Mycolicibacterium phlei]EID13329.1 TetR family transcriptional regulator [Mycolicibacterium phlei RIVM601174]KAB7756420.1 TetR family transcriptional regulator [Mycolicibacterium phlei DSM 43239 = CCUG 21000]KXW61839.1 TetR family transcriptional regulator [Mycolicibacterium phlei DSM 43072]